MVSKTWGMATNNALLRFLWSQSCGFRSTRVSQANKSPTSSTKTLLRHIITNNNLVSKKMTKECSVTALEKYKRLQTCKYIPTKLLKVNHRPTANSQLKTTQLSNMDTFRALQIQMTSTQNRSIYANYAEKKRKRTT